MRQFRFLLAVFVFLWCGSAASASMIGLPTRVLTRAAGLVVDARVVQVQSYWSGDGTKILTGASLAVIETVRGDGSRRLVTVEYEGGEVGDIGLQVSDTRPLVVGERVLVFLKAQPSSEQGEVYEFVGQAQGVYAIGEDGRATKAGFSLVGGWEDVDNDIDLDALKRIIRSVR